MVAGPRDLQDLLRECIFQLSKFEYHGTYTLTFYQNHNLVMVLLQEMLGLEVKDKEYLFRRTVIALL